jgi:hypothetical protein
MMVYGEVLKNEWHMILPKKAKYTKRDIDRVYMESLLDSTLNSGHTFTEQQARFIVICTAIFHDAEYSKAVARQTEEYIIK